MLPDVECRKNYIYILALKVDAVNICLKINYFGRFLAKMSQKNCLLTFILYRLLYTTVDNFVYKFTNQQQITLICHNFT